MLENNIYATIFLSTINLSFQLYFTRRLVKFINFFLRLLTFKQPVLLYVYILLSVSCSYLVYQLHGEEIFLFVTILCLTQHSVILCFDFNSLIMETNSYQQVLKISLKFLDEVWSVGKNG